MADTDKLIETIDKVSDLVDQAISTNDYSELSRQIGKAVRDASESVAKSAAAFAADTIDSATKSSSARKAQKNANPYAANGGQYNPYGNQYTGNASAAGNPYTGYGPNYANRAQYNRANGASYANQAQYNQANGASYGNPAERAWARQKYGRETAADRMRRERAERLKAEKQAKDQMEAYAQQYFARPGNETGAVIQTVIGGALTVIFGVLLLIFTASTIAGANTLFPLIVNAIGMAAGITILLKGRKAARKAVHFKSYRKLLLPKLYMDVKDISEKTKIPEATVVKELEEFTENKMIRQGHFDAQKKTFIASDEIYEQYKATEKQAELLRQQAEEEAKKKAAYTPEVRELLDQGSACIRMIHEANLDIPGEEVSEKLDRMENIVIRIFEEVKRRPELAGSLNMFMNYYLPTTTKLIDAYRQMDKQEVQGENIRTAKHEIENSLDTINDAFEKLLDSFYKEQAMDVSSDISVMKMMMKQEGLAPDDLTAMKQRQEQMKAKQAQRAAEGKTQAASAPAEAQPAPAAQTQPAPEPEPSLKAPWGQPIDFNAYEPGLASGSAGQVLSAPWESQERKS